MLPMLPPILLRPMLRTPPPHSSPGGQHSTQHKKEMRSSATRTRAGTAFFIHRTLQPNSQIYQAIVDFHSDDYKHYFHCPSPKLSTEIELEEMRNIIGVIASRYPYAFPVHSYKMT
jgi:hypothetical protein